MTDNSDIQIGIGFKTDKQSVTEAKAAVASVDKALQEIERSKALGKMAEDAAKQAKATGNSAKATAELVEQMKKLGASSAEVKKTISAYDTATKAIERQEQAVKDLAESQEQAARAAEAAARKQAESQAAAGSVTSRADRVGGAAGKLRGAASLVGGGEVAGVVNDIGDAVSGVKELGSALGLGLNPATLAVTGAVVAAGVAFHIVTEGIRADQAKLQQELDSRRTAADAAFSGATVSDAKAAIESYNQEIAKQDYLIGKATKTAEDEFAQLVRNKEQSLGIFADLSARLQTALGLSEVSTAQADAEKSKQLRKDAEADAKAYQDLLDEGLFKTDEAAKSEEQLAEARVQTTTATNNAKVAQEKAAREQERVAAEQQRKQEQAQQEAERATQQAAQSQLKYAQTLEDVKRNSTQALEDIGRKSKQASADLTKSLGRDLLGNETKYLQDVQGLQLKTQRSEAQRLKEHGRKIEDIQAESFKSEEDLRKSRNFLAIADARDAEKEKYEAAQKELERGTEDAGDEYKQQRIDLKRALDLQQADRRTAFGYQRADQAENLKREIEQAGIAKKRNLETAAIGYQREQEQLARHLQAMGGLRQQSYGQEFAQASGGRGGFNGAVPAPANIGSAAAGLLSNIQNQITNMRTNNLTVNTNSDTHAVRLLKRAGY